MVFWQSKQILNSGKHYQMPKIVANRPKGMELHVWEGIVRDYKYNKLVVLDRVPKTRKDDKDKKNKEKRK